MCALCVLLIPRWWKENKDRVREYQQRVADYRNNCAAHNNDAWGSRASSSGDAWGSQWAPAPHPPALVVPDPPAPQAPPNNTTHVQQQLFQMHQALAQNQMTNLMQLAQSNTEQGQAMLRTMMEVLLRMAKELWGMANAIECN